MKKKKNKSAQNMVGLRWAKMTTEEKSEYGKMMARARARIRTQNLLRASK